MIVHCCLHVVNIQIVIKYVTFVATLEQVYFFKCLEVYNKMVYSA